MELCYNALVWINKKHPLGINRVQNDKSPFAIRVRTPEWLVNADCALLSLARFSDTCQESVPLCRSEGADFVFSTLNSSAIRTEYPSFNRFQSLWNSLTLITFVSGNSEPLHCWETRKTFRIRIRLNQCFGTAIKGWRTLKNISINRWHDWRNYSVYKYFLAWTRDTEIPASYSTGAFAINCMLSDLLTDRAGDELSKR